MKLHQSFFLVFMLTIVVACNTSQEVADMVILNGNVATIDKENPTAEALAIKDGKILKVGTNDDIKKLIGEETEQIDAQGNFVMPGFIEGHGHFSGLGKSLIKLNFMKTQNWDEIVAMVAEKAKTAKPGEWIEGRGWHQEKWNQPLDKQVQGYPYHDKLSEVSPNNPVILRHASGHSLFANKAAMDAAGVSKETPDPSGGHILRSPDGEAIGVFEERAMTIINTAYSDYLDGLDQATLEKEWYEGIRLAEEDCLKKGVTSFQDAGSSFTELDRYKKMAEDGELDLRLWAMVRHSYDRMEGNMDGLPIIGAGNDFFTCRAIKSEIDGALGAYGAWLLKPYSDKTDFHGQNTTTLEELQKIANLAKEKDMQLCVHAIGDRGNREVLNIFEKNIDKDNMRWRMEHAQHINLADIPRFKDMGIIASMQGVHCTSDAPFVPKRLGEFRAKEEAYPWRKLIDAGVVVSNGTDAPVEDVDPIISYYASVTRMPKNADAPFFPEQSMTRLEALESYTINCAYAAFEEDIKGSLTEGKYADIVILSEDLLNTPDEKILDTKVLYTIVGGEVKHKL